MDILVSLRDFFINFIYGLPVGLSSVILRLGFFLLLSSACLYASWMYLPYRTVFSQTFVLVLTFVISLYVHVENLRGGSREFFVLFVVMAFLCMIFLPGKLPFWLTPRLGTQLRLGRIIKAAIWGILILQIFVR